ncbi:MAG TPA: DUF1697 domain-containing protein [Chitinophagaceae bacterium]|nr:DUF1697 domain-containing protein [Chitinophagaceae bacterium]
MQTIIAILRGINVGKNQLKMADLKALYESLKCREVVTYIQSGNVVCKCPASLAPAQLSKKVEHQINKQYGIVAPVITLNINEMAAVVAANPFVSQPGINAEKLHVAFFAETPAQENINNAMQYDYPPDKFIMAGKHVYLYCPGGYGITKFSNTFFENKLKVTATTRNWRTVNILLQMAQQS